MPIDCAMRRLSTAARTCAPKRVRSSPSHSAVTSDRAAEDQEAAVGREIADAEIDLAAEPARRLHRLRERAPEIGGAAPPT